MMHKKINNVKEEKKQKKIKMEIRNSMEELDRAEVNISGH